MRKVDIINQIQAKKSYLCIGLDTDIEKIPSSIAKMEFPLFEFNKRIVDATHDLTIAYKPNIAFYESYGVAGWINLTKTVEYIKEKYPNIFLIADAKRGDIGNTSKMYAKAFFENLPFDSVTVAPYMGSDSVEPFLTFPNKWVILLGLTSNQGAFDFQFLKDAETQQHLYETVLSKSSQWGNDENMMYVVGATKAEMLANIRTIIPHHFLLVPGVGSQGGSLEKVSEYGMNKDCGLLVNSSREIIYASSNDDFDVKAREKAKELQQQMAYFLEKFQR